ncbi:hypothetical protein [Croceicoccus mobilis]|uniref:Uncharacterized protein n=1 Tax=Croceicoccus mobilis TaxID=1703339 RepID=A0A916Z313_9SPHN|nr:hypothetical protein [Croceicoccus mobilis]GGD73870.1 hypothetical protein GCM10010990_24370 [Croceicoccus mobilis]
MVAAIPAALAVGGRVIQGIGAYQAGKANSKALMAERRDTMREGADRELQSRAEARSKIGEQVAASFANGFEGGSGTALNALKQSQINAAMDVLTIRRETQGRAAGLKAQAKQEKRRGKFALIEGILSAGSAAAGADWGSPAKAGSS